MSDKEPVDALVEEHLIQRQAGKWGDPAVPKHGWTSVEVVDHGSPTETCEMCEQQSIRYEHIMVHEAYGQLGCGCICAGYMEEDVEAARTRQRDAAKRAAKAKRDAGRPKFIAEWRQSSAGNWWTKAPGGWRLTVYRDRRSDRWCFMFVEGDSKPVFHTAKFDDPREAMLAAEAKFKGALTFALDAAEAKFTSR